MHKNLRSRERPCSLNLLQEQSTRRNFPFFYTDLLQNAMNYSEMYPVGVIASQILQNMEDTIIIDWIVRVG